MEESEFRLLVKHCFLMGKNPIQTQQWLERSYGNACPPKTKILRWFADFEKGRTDKDDAERNAEVKQLD